MTKKNLPEIIRANPGCHAVIDNDGWWLYREAPDANPHTEEGREDAFDAWDEANLLADSSDDFGALGDGGYGSGCSYGGDLLQALAIIVGVTVGSV